MAAKPPDRALHHLRHTLLQRQNEGVTDADLLRRFVWHRVRW
ncbi:MAG TPA: hypothetical protein VFA18_01960 [Gemmataceae bacterium]|nr:hypothetical protein [Gemmataceae bacterium]